MEGEGGREGEEKEGGREGGGGTGGELLPLQESEGAAGGREWGGAGRGGDRMVGDLGDLVEMVDGGGDV